MIANKNDFCRNSPTTALIHSFVLYSYQVETFPLFLHSLFCPFPSPCNVTRDDHDIEFPGGSTLQCGTRLWDDMPLNSPKRPPYWNSTSGFDFDHITAVDMSSCISLQNFIHRRKITSCRFSRWRISAMLDFIGPLMGSLKSPCTTSYR